MRILMLGWEFPPFIAGGLGVACHGLTRALDKQGHEVTFILPRPVGSDGDTHVRLLAPEARRPPPVPSRTQAAPGTAARRPSPATGGAETGSGSGGAGSPQVEEPSPTFPADLERTWDPAQEAVMRPSGFERATFRTVPATFSNPYSATGPAGEAGGEAAAGGGETGAGGTGARAGGPAGEAPRGGEGVSSDGGDAGGGDGGSESAGDVPEQGATYGRDLVGDAERYARMVVSMASGLEFEVIHAHDWLTFPAGLALARVTGKPLVMHVHATEFDRSGEHVNQQVYEIERRGLHGASRVIAVSMLTKSICAYRYGVPGDRVDVIYNGINEDDAQPTSEDRIASSDKIVLFLGRLTMQKGPEFFVAAAKRVLERIPNVKFVVAGTGDMAVRMIEMAAQLGIGHRVLFTGFLHREDVLRVYRMADCYVMPSVSEPFGLVALEAIQNDVPAIISKQSGAAEVLTHVLKVDFWDVDEIANKIVAVLRHPPLGATLRQHGPMELRRLTWDGAAARVIQTYEAAGVDIATDGQTKRPSQPPDGRDARLRRE